MTDISKMELGMEPKARRTKRNIQKTTRGRYFEVCVLVGLTTVQVGLGNNRKNIVPFLKVCKFLTQIILEIALYYLRIPDRGRDIVLKDFRGQLELDRITKMPFWKVYVETTGLTTKKCLYRALFGRLFPAHLGLVKEKGHPRKLEMRSILRVSYASNLEKLVEENRFSISKSDWSPGYFDKKTVEFKVLFLTDEVQSYLEDWMDEKKGKYLKILKSSLIEKFRKHAKDFNEKDNDNRF